MATFNWPITSQVLPERENSPSVPLPLMAIVRPESMNRSRWLTPSMKPKDLARYILVMSPLFLGLVVGYTVQIPLSNIQILYLGIPLLAGALLFSALSYRITKFVVGKYGVEEEINPFARASFQRGTGGRDHRRLWIGLLGIACLDYFLAPNVWLFLVGGGFGAMFLDWLNDYLVLRKKAGEGAGMKPTPSERL